MTWFQFNLGDFYKEHNFHLKFTFLGLVKA